MDYTDGQSFVRYFENIRSRTTRVIERIPRDQLQWRPAPGAFSFADLIRHIAATERHMFGENVQDRPSRYPGHDAKLADGYDAVLEYYHRMHDETIEILKRLSPEDMQRKVTTPGGISITTWKWLRGMIEHEVHHRGQIYLMLRLLGVETPALYGMTSEEVLARSTR